MNKRKKHLFFSRFIHSFTKNDIPNTNEKKFTAWDNDDDDDVLSCQIRIPKQTEQKKKNFWSKNISIFFFSFLAIVQMTNDD